jgi:phage gp37-like protein
MPGASAFGPLVAASDMEDAVLAQLQAWLPDYLAEVERTHGLQVGSLPQPRSWVLSSEVERFPEEQLPAVMLASPGLTDPPLADGTGIYTARWQLVVAVQVNVRGNRLALRVARLYALALRGALLQQQRLGLPLRRIDWMDERYRLLDSIDDRTTCVAEVEVAVEVAAVLSRQAGPLEPLLPPGSSQGPDSPTWPVALTADVAVTKTEE